MVQRVVTSFLTKLMSNKKLWRRTQSTSAFTGSTNNFKSRNIYLGLNIILCYPRQGIKYLHVTEIVIKNTKNVTAVQKFKLFKHLFLVELYNLTPGF